MGGSRSDARLGVMSENVCVSNSVLWKSANVPGRQADSVVV
jgi:hypothetical protein